MLAPSSMRLPRHVKDPGLIWKSLLVILLLTLLLTLILVLGMRALGLSSGWGRLHPLLLVALLLGVGWATGVTLKHFTRAIRALPRLSEAEARSQQAQGWVADWNTDKVSGAWVTAMVGVPLILGHALGLFFHPRASLPAAILLCTVGGVLSAGLLSFALHRTMVYFIHGSSVLHLEGVPARLGRALRGTIYTHAAFPADTVVQLTLSCSETTRTYSPSEQDPRVKTRTIWEKRWAVPAGPVISGPEEARSALSVDMDLPAELDETREGGPHDIRWRLTAQLRRSGVPYRASFALPVSRTPPPASR